MAFQSSSTNFFLLFQLAEFHGLLEFLKTTTENFHSELCIWEVRQSFIVCKFINITKKALVKTLGKCSLGHEIY